MSYRQNTTAGGKYTFQEGAWIPKTTLITATGALDVSCNRIIADTTAGAIAASLADGEFDGQRLEIILAVDGGTNLVVTYNGTATATFANAKQMLEVEWIEDASDWVVVLNVGTVVIA